MKKILIILAPLIILFFAVSVNRLIAPEKRAINTSPSSTPEKTPAPVITQTSISATFLIYTNNTKRIFTDSEYHGLSENVYISSEDPEKIIVKKIGTTWQDFFTTLPMKLSPTCLTTGTNQQFCTNQTSSLKFFINGRIDRDALSKTIQNRDKLLVSYGPISDPNLPLQLQQ